MHTGADVLENIFFSFGNKSIVGRCPDFSPSVLNPRLRDPLRICVSLQKKTTRKALCKALRMHWNTGIGAIDVAAGLLGAGKGLLKVIISHRYFQCNRLCCYSLLFLCYISFINFQTDLLS